MRHFKIIFLSVALLISNAAYAKSDIEFLLDLSGSMRKKSGAETQIDIARKALMNAIKDVPADSLIALRTYGHRVEQQNKAESCKDTELIIPLGPVNKETIEAKINALTPKGYTPIAYSLEQSKNDFKTEREADKVIILLSDGEETCGGDPVAVLKKLKEAGFEVVVHTVGFNVDAKTRQQLEAIAAAGNGHYYDAQGAAALTEALKEATKESLVIEKEKKTYGEAIRGGDSYETAVPIAFDVEHKLDHHQKISYFDYFYVDLKPGKELTITMQTLEKGINLRGEKPRETGNPYAGFQFHGGNRNNLKTVNLIGSAHNVKSFSYTPPQEGRYYLLIGSTYDDMNKDHVTFKLTLTSRGDLNTEEDAGGSLTQAKAIEAKRYTKNYIGGSDLKDVYSFDAKKGDDYFVGLIPNGDSGSYFRIAIFDSYKQKIMSQTSGIGEGLRSKQFKIPDDGTYYLQIELGTNVSRPIAYTLELKNLSAKPEPAEAAATDKPAESTTPAAPKPAAKPTPKPKAATEPPKKDPLDDSGPLTRPSRTELPKTPPASP